MTKTVSLDNNEAHPAVTSNALFEEMLRLTRDFLDTVQIRAPKSEEIASFSQARQTIFCRLQPMLEKETALLSNEAENRKINPALQSTLNQLTSYKEKLKEIDLQLSERIAEHHKEIDTKMKELKKGKKGLLNYLSHKKTAPRFCRKYA